MTYNVSGGTLNLTQLQHLVWRPLWILYGVAQDTQRNVTYVCDARIACVARRRRGCVDTESSR